MGNIAIIAAGRRGRMTGRGLIAALALLALATAMLIARQEGVPALSTPKNAQAPHDRVLAANLPKPAAPASLAVPNAQAVAVQQSAAPSAALPPLDSLLAPILDELKARAAQGNAPAACRL